MRAKYLSTGLETGFSPPVSRYGFGLRRDELRGVLTQIILFSEIPFDTQEVKMFKSCTTQLIHSPLTLSVL